MMLWGTMPHVRVVVPAESIAAKLVRWFRSWYPAPSARMMTQEEYRLLIAKRRLIGRGQCQHCGADALAGVCDRCWEDLR